MKRTIRNKFMTYRIFPKSPQKVRKGKKKVKRGKKS